MSQLPSALIFYGVAALVLISAAGVAFSRNILHSAFALLGTLAGVAGLYLFLGADFVGIAQIIIYVGGILVLILFAVMFSSHAQESPGEVRRGPLALAAAAILALAVFLCLVLLLGGLSPAIESQAAQHATEAYRRTANVAASPSARGLGHLLLGEYFLPFELAGVVILAALLGAVVIARKETRG